MRLVRTFISVILLLFIIPGCAGQQPILVGVSMELTGRRGDLGVEARDGAILAVEQINANGGVNGRPIELLIRDDKGDPELARQLDADLIDAGVVAIIGHITSEQTAAAIDQINAAEVVLISPTSSSSYFSNQADYFFRVTPGTDFYGEALAKHIYNNRDIREIIGIYDISNQAFTEALWFSAKEAFEALGGDASQAFTFFSGETDLKELMELVSEDEPEALVFISSPVDTALMIQYARQLGITSRLFSSTWAGSQELLDKGGAAVEGLELISVYNMANTSPNFQDFIDDFKARYNRAPGSTAAYGFEAVILLVEGLRQTEGQAEGLPEALTSIKNLAGVQSGISLDQYGDVSRDVFIDAVINRQFVTIATISTEE
ncbi:MAG: ABC transporter substrate-binding protein [Anaerolineales bacterium]|nr:ABC transporter substrate-binding protein [Anaerolineales bacterium]